MNSASLRAPALIVVGGAVVALLVARPRLSDAGSGHGHDDEQHEAHHEGAAEPARGPHGGRMLVADDGFALEWTLYEPGIPPQSRVFPTHQGRPLDPATVGLEVELERFDRRDTLRYRKVDDFLMGDREVEEPHSFVVHLRAKHDQHEHTFTFESFEGRVEISDARAQASGLVIETAGPRELERRLPVLGRLTLASDARRAVSARYDGTVRTMTKRVGEAVRAGETLATVEASETLQAFEVTAPIAGVVLDRHANPGEHAHAGEPLFIIADPSALWVEFALYRDDALEARIGQRFTVLGDARHPPAEGKLVYVSPTADVATQSVTARAALRSPAPTLRAGLMLRGEVTVETVRAPVVVRREALQSFRDWEVVFRKRGAVYEIAIVELGVVDGDYVEVRRGLAAGEPYVAGNSFVVKAELGKAGATHDH